MPEQACLRLESVYERHKKTGLYEGCHTDPQPQCSSGGSYCVTCNVYWRNFDGYSAGAHVNRISFGKCRVQADGVTIFGWFW